MEYSGEHLSPPSTLSRQSDSDASDVDDCCSGRRVGADGASISSLGSSIRYVLWRLSKHFDTEQYNNFQPTA